MLQKTNAIVLGSIKYSDSSLIVNCFTEAYGFKTYILKGILKSKKTGINKAHFQSLTQLNIVAYHNSKGKLNSIKEARVTTLYKSLHTDIIKQSLVLFITEVLNSVLREEEENEALFSYLKNALLWLDSQEKIANFHLLFLLQLTKYLGFYPDTSHPTDTFDLLEGKFVLKPQSNFFIEKTKISHFKALLGTNFDALSDMKLTTAERYEILEVLIQYIRLHLHTFQTPKSLAVLQSLF